MNAVLKDSPVFRPMRRADIGAVMEIETEIYEFPWTPGNFRDSLNAGYSCVLLLHGEELVGYGVLMLAANEAHLLNMSVAARWQRQGYGRALLDHFTHAARAYHANMIFLEVRPSNHAALSLYTQAGFSEIAVRRNYYQATEGRENAIVMSLNLK